VTTATQEDLEGSIAGVGVERSRDSDSIAGVGVE
jgi:hypothetical protein